MGYEENFIIIKSIWHSSQVSGLNKLCIDALGLTVHHYPRRIDAVQGIIAVAVQCCGVRCCQ